MSERALRLSIAALSLLGAGIAGYLTAVRYGGAPLACATGGCETVQSSRYAELAGVPVAVLGLVSYVALLTSAATRAAWARAGAAAVALAGTIFALYLLAVQIWVIGALCQWCLASDVAIAALAVLTVVRALGAIPAAGAAPPAVGARRAPRRAAPARARRAAPSSRSRRAG